MTGLQFIFALSTSLSTISYTQAQMRWTLDSTFQPGLPASMKVYKNQNSLDGKPCIAYYTSISLTDKDLIFDTDTTMGRRLTPQSFYQRLETPLLVINGTFFSFATNQNLNAVMHDGRLISYNQHTVKGTGPDSMYYFHPFRGAFGLSISRRPDIAWLYTDSTHSKPYAFQKPRAAMKNVMAGISIKDIEPRINHLFFSKKKNGIEKKWKMQTAIGGGPVLIQDGQIFITSKEERMFVNTEEVKHPRTAIGYTRNALIILCVQGRYPGIAEGASLTQLALMLKDLGCIEAINLDGGGSSCMLINGKETIKPSDPGGQRAVPAVFYVKRIKQT